MPGVRSKAYPAIDLGTAVRRAEQLQKNLGNNGWYTRQVVATGMGYKSLSGVATRAIAALVHFGLLERRKDTYKLSDLATHITLPISEEDKQEALLAALREPELYRELLNTFGDGPLPGALPNVLAHSYGINPNASQHAANAFIASAEIAGVLRDGVFKSESNPKTGVSADELYGDEEHINDDGRPSAQNQVKSQPNYEDNTIVRRLPSGILIGFPADLDFAVMTGQFGVQIMAIEDKAQELLGRNVEGKGPDEKAESERNV
jgi:hypothetical protein